MDKVILTKMGIIAGSLTLIVMMAIGCNFILREAPDPMVSNPDEAFVTVGNITITRGALYKHLKASDGLAHLLNYVDEMVLEDYINAIDEDAVEQEFLLIKYGTNDPDELEDLFKEIEEDDELRDTIERAFATRLLDAGFDPDDDEEVARFMRLTLATRQATIDKYINNLFEAYDKAVADGDEDAKDPMVTFADFYNSRYRGEAIAIELVFRNEDEVDAFMQKHNLVLDFEGGIGLYEDDDVPYDEAEEFDEDNTRLLTDEEVFEYFILLYNELYQYRDQLDTNLTWDDLDAFDAPWFHFDSYAMRNDRQRDQLNRIFGDLGWQDLEDDDDEENGEQSFVRYTPEAKPYRANHDRYGNYYVMTFLLDHTDATPFDELDEARQEEIMAEYVKAELDLRGSQQRFTNETMIRLRHEFGFTFHDNALRMSYDIMGGTLAETYTLFERRDDAIATIDGVTISVDDFFEYMVRRVGAIAISELYKRAMLFEGPLFEERFGTNRNLRSTDDPTITEYRRDINTAYRTFSQFFGGEFRWDDFLFLEGFYDDFDYVRKRVHMDLIPLLYRDNIDIDRAIDKAVEMREIYIHLKVENILIYVDMDGDLSPDNFADFLDNHDDIAAFETMRDALEDLILDMYEDGESLEDIVDSFNSAIRIDDESPWAEYINAGFKLMYENLTPEDDQYINFFNVDRFVPEFSERLYAIYDYYIMPERLDDDFVLDPFGLLETRFGLHLIGTSKGDADDRFIIPSAAFDDPEGEYDPRFLNADDLPTRDQIELWMQAFIESTFFGDTDIAVPADVDHALGIHLDGYLRNTLPNLQVQQSWFGFPQLGISDPFGTLLVIEEIIAADVTFPMYNDRLHKMLDAWRAHYRVRTGYE